MTQTTPTRDETVLEALEPFANSCDNHFHDASILDKFEDDASVLMLVRDGKLSPTGVSVGDLRRAKQVYEAAMLASAPASGGVDAVTIINMCADIALAAGPADYKAKTGHDRLPCEREAFIAKSIRMLASLAPAATPVSEARCAICNGTGVTNQSFGMGTSPGECPVCSRAKPTPVSEAASLAKGCCSASSPCFHQKHDPTTICEACRNAGLRAEEALAKPASSRETE